MEKPVGKRPLGRRETRCTEFYLLSSACSLVPAASTVFSVIYCLSRKEIFKGVSFLVLIFSV
jgi:hypothetical protein